MCLKNVSEKCMLSIPTVVRVCGCLPSSPRRWTSSASRRHVLSRPDSPRAHTSPFPQVGDLAAAILSLVVAACHVPIEAVFWITVGANLLAAILAASSLLARVPHLNSTTEHEHPLDNGIIRSPKDAQSSIECVGILSAACL